MIAALVRGAFVIRETVGASEAEVAVELTVLVLFTVTVAYTATHVATESTDTLLAWIALTIIRALDVINTATVERVTHLATRAV